MDNGLNKKKVINDLNQSIAWEYNLVYFPMCYFISNRFSPYVSYYCMKYKKTPNQITGYMILSGAIGGLLFALPNILAKIVGMLLIQLWFVFDCSDGEVARYQKKFSKFGSELDFMAHLIDHPLIIFGFFCSLYQLHLFSLTWLIAVVLISLLGDALMRNLIVLEKYTLPADSGNSRPKSEVKLDAVNIIKFFYNFGLFYPNFILFGVLIYFIDYFLHTPFLFALFIFNIICSVPIIFKKTVRLTKMYYQS